MFRVCTHICTSTNVFTPTLTRCVRLCSEGFSVSYFLSVSHGSPETQPTGDGERCMGSGDLGQGSRAREPYNLAWASRPARKAFLVLSSTGVEAWDPGGRWCESRSESEESKNRL